jgi:hypothetical protein
MTTAFWSALRGRGILGLMAFLWTATLAVAQATPLGVALSACIVSKPEIV